MYKYSKTIFMQRLCGKATAMVVCRKRDHSPTRLFHVIVDYFIFLINQTIIITAVSCVQVT